MAIQKHVVVISREDGATEIHPMKQWLRDHPGHVPPGLDVSTDGSTSRQLRAGLRKMGWTLEESPTEVRLFPPGQSVDSLGDTDGEAEEDDGPYFALEYQLRDFLAENLGLVDIAGKRLRLYEDGKSDGVEYPTAVGSIDILATDSEGNFYVFELKRAKSADKAIGQVARYMGWIKQTLGAERQTYGVIVARAISDNLKYAVGVVPNVFLFEYRVSFSLTAAGGR